MLVRIHSLFEQIKEAEFEPLTPLYLCLHRLQETKMIESLFQIELICDKKLVEEYGLATTLSSLPNDKGRIDFYKTLLLGACPFRYLARLVTEYNMLRSVFVLYAAAKPEANVNELDSALTEKRNLVKTLKLIYFDVKSATIFNPEDPVSLEKLTEPTVRWSEDGIVFGMNQSSVKEFVKKNSFTDLLGKIQITNPYTNRIISYPWREELLICAND